MPDTAESLRKSISRLQFFMGLSRNQRKEMSDLTKGTTKMRMRSLLGGVAIAYLVSNFSSHGLDEAPPSWIKGAGKHKVLPYLSIKRKGSVIPPKA